MPTTTAVTVRPATPILLLGLCLAAVGLALGAVPAAADDKAVGGRVAFIRADNIWVADLAAGTLKQLTTSGDCAAPSWSADGAKLVYIRRATYQEAHLWVLEVAAGKAARLTTKPSTYLCPRWSPDGQTVACFAYDDGVEPTVDDDPSRLVTINVATKAVTVLQQGLWGAMDLAWSPNGRAVVYSCGAQGRGTLLGLLLDSQGTAPTVLRAPSAPDEPPVTLRGLRFPTPTTIAYNEFVTTEPTTLTVRQVNADGTTTTAREFGAAGTAAIPLSNSADSSGPWLLTVEQDLVAWQDGEQAKLFEQAGEPAWTAQP